MTDEQEVPSLSRFTVLPSSMTDVVMSNTIPSGAFERSLYRALRTRINAPIEEGGFGGNENFGLQDSPNEEMIGSTPFLQILADEILEPLGAGTLAVDMSNPQLLNAIKSNFYIDRPKLVMRDNNNTSERNAPLQNHLREIVGVCKAPVLVSGFRVVPWADDTKGYGLKLEKTGDFKVVESDLLSSKYHEWKFDKTDENDLPVGLDKERGSRTWYTFDASLSGLCVNGYLVASCDEDLAYSDGDGRVVAHEIAEGNSQ